MRQMLGRDFVQSRLGEEGAGISYAEFSYSLIQGYDFLHLHREKGVTLQLCGADQWGNSITGVDLIRRLTGNEAHVWSAPLIINKSTGVKFGKSEDGAVWLDANKTSVFKFYQFWLNVDDESVIDLIKVYTLLDKNQIDDLQARFHGDKASRLAQRTLAYEVTALVHGKEHTDAVKRISETLFGDGDYKILTLEDMIEIKKELPTAVAKIGETPLHEIMVQTGLAESNGDARRFLADSAVYINGLQFSSDKNTFDSTDVISGHAIIRRGKNTSAVVDLTE
jgi:tyrosyl-tRNA synthetase